MSKLLFGFVLAFLSCCFSYAGNYLYWEELSDSSISETIKSLNIDVNIEKLYLHQISLSDDSLSVVILDTLCVLSEVPGDSTWHHHPRGREMPRR